MTSQEENKEASGSKGQDVLLEMKERLINAGAYEDGMSYKDMEEVLKVLDASADMHRNSHTLKPPESSPIEKTPSLSQHKSPMENNREDKKNYSNAVKNSKSSSDNVPSTRKESNEGNSASESKTWNFSKDNIPLTDSQKELQRMKKVTMDPTKVIPHENDRHLRQREFDNEYEPFSLCNDMKNAKLTSRVLVEKMSDYLQEIRDELIGETGPAADDKPFQWGEAIKVGTRNSNLEKKSVTRSEPPEVVEPVREFRSRASKRKAASLIANINSVSDSEPEIDDDTGMLKKRKSQQKERSAATVDESDVQMDVDEETINFESPSTSSRTIYFANDSKIEISEDEDIFESRVEKSPEPFIPRRIIPPNPGTNKARRGKSRGGKPCYKGPRSKKSTENIIETTETDKTLFSQIDSPPEILLDNDDVKFEDNSKPTDVKMLKMPLRERTKLANKKLEEINNQEKQIIEQKKILFDEIQENKKKHQEDVIKRRLAEDEETKRLAKEKEEQENRNRKKWNQVLNDKVRKNEKSRGLTDEEIRRKLEEENVYCDDHTSSSTSENRVPCPICNRFFPESDIENHASGCNQFDLDPEERSSPIIGTRRRKNNNLAMHECHVCDNYRTPNNNEYLEHVQICTEEYRQRKDIMNSGNEVQYQGPMRRKGFIPKERRFN